MGETGAREEEVGQCADGWGAGMEESSVWRQEGKLPGPSVYTLPSGFSGEAWLGKRTGKEE